MIVDGIQAKRRKVKLERQIRRKRSGGGGGDLNNKRRITRVTREYHKRVSQESITREHRLVVAHQGTVG